MNAKYEQWLIEQKYDPGTIKTQLYRVGRVEESYGSLDDHHADGTFQGVIDVLRYSTSDARQNKPNPSKIPFNGDIRNNLQSYKNAVVRYQKFLTGWERSDTEPPSKPEAVKQLSETSPEFEEPVRQKLSLERDMQAALRRDISSLHGTLKIIDDGAERSVDSGFIDILCEDTQDGSIVVIELKADKADSRAIGQILGYMGDVAGEEEDKSVRGILVAHDFDKRSKSAARVVPSLSLVRYSVSFKFDQQE
jgi:endonuclease